MEHVLLGWGSLIWDEGDHPLKLASKWTEGGPKLPLEFSRVSESRSDALTLVIDPKNGVDCPTMYAVSERRSLDNVICDLRCREGTVIRRIGFVDLATGEQRANQHPAMASHVRGWAQSRGFGSVVWTDLPSNFDSDGRGSFGVDSALRHLQRLSSEGAVKAKQYITGAPTFVVTPLRTALERVEWWPDFGAA